MEMEMVIFESFSVVEKVCDSCSDTDLCSDVRMAMAMQTPPLSSPSNLLEYLLDIAIAWFRRRNREIEMGEAFLATVDGKELEKMMIMLKPVNSCLSTEEVHGVGDFVSSEMETEMVSQMHLES